MTSVLSVEAAVGSGLAVDEVVRFRTVFPLADCNMRCSCSIVSFVLADTQNGLSPVWSGSDALGVLGVLGRSFCDSTGVPFAGITVPAEVAVDALSVLVALSSLTLLAARNCG